MAKKLRTKKVSKRGSTKRSRKSTPTAGFLSAKYDVPGIPDYVVAELKYESPVAYSASGFAAPAESENQARSLNRVLSRFKVADVRSHLGARKTDIKRRMSVAAALPAAPKPSAFAKKGLDATFIQSGFVEVVVKQRSDAKKLASALNRNSNVWEAHVAPRPVPAAAPSGSQAGSRNFEPAQGYLHDPPNGIGACGIWNLAGARGERVTICDIEGNWNRRHEDLPRGIRLIGGTVIPTLGWKDHGTAVLGEMVSKASKTGTVGIAHRAKAVVQSAVINGVFNTAAAIINAARRLNKGDVILIELQATGPNGKYVAMQYWNPVFSAIRIATDKGITVVEAAGNGDEDFSLPIFNNTGLQKDSGAIVVGAGVPPTNYADFFGAGPYGQYDRIGNPRSRIWFSNYGKIVNVHGWGWHVTTLGYGDAQGGASQNRWYTHRFSGTSSASPIVTGAVACLQGRSIAKRGRPLTPAAVRRILMSTGTPQQAGPDVPTSQRIGPLPNLLKAIRRV